MNYLFVSLVSILLTCISAAQFLNDRDEIFIFNNDTVNVAEIKHRFKVEIHLILDCFIIEFF